jgi:S1-C subfamily serine protease
MSTVVAIIVIAMLLCAGSGIGGALIVSQSAAYRNQAGNGEPVNYTITPSEEALTTTEAVAKKVLDSVVGISTEYSTYGGSTGGIGTGMIVDENGYILTNSHVVNDGKVNKITVSLSSGEEVAAELLWNDETIDLAMVKIDPGKNDLKAVDLGDSDKIIIGSYTAAIGNPLGLEFNGSITQGVVSGLNRTLNISSGTGAVVMEGLIQIDASINPGNSGGPLLNSEGKVIGVNTAKASAEGMGFAIPINTAKPIIEKVIKDGTFERAYLGISASSAKIMAEEYPSLNIESDQTGAYITKVTAGSPADKAGLKVKDIITEVNGEAVTGSTDLIATLLKYSPGDTVKITYFRGSKAGGAEVKLVSQSQIDFGDEEIVPEPDDSESNDYWGDWKYMFPEYW